MLPHDGGDAERELAEFTRAGVNLDALGDQLQREGADAFVKSWDDLMAQIAAKSEMLRKAS
jgi:transaldolase